MPFPLLTLLRRLLLLPLLAPLLAVLLVAALNPKPSLSVRLLTGRSAALPLGVWLAGGAAGGALLSALATSLALLDGQRRHGSGGDAAPSEAPEPWNAPSWSGDRDTAPAEREMRARPAAETEVWPQAGPERGPSEPPPTVSVPFRVLRRPSRSAAPAAERAATGPARSEPVHSPGHATGASLADDDWNTPADEDW